MCEETCNVADDFNCLPSGQQLANARLGERCAQLNGEMRRRPTAAADCKWDEVPDALTQEDENMDRGGHTKEADEDKGCDIRRCVVIEIDLGGL